jgi:hypothetical protein
LPNGTAEVLADIEGLPVLVRLLVQDVPAEMRPDLVTDADIHSLLSRTLEKAVERMRGSPLRRDDPSKQPLAIVELISHGAASVRPSAPLTERMLRVGPLDDAAERYAVFAAAFHQAHEAEPPPELGYYAEPPEMGYYGEPPEFGGYAQAPNPYGYYGEPPEMGWYAEPPEMAGYAEPIEYYAEDMPMAGYGYAQMPEMVGYSEYEPLAEDYPGMSCYGEPDMSGYVRETRRPTYNPGCPIPTNVAGYGEAAPLEGYVRPAPVTAARSSPTVIILASSGS